MNKMEFFFNFYFFFGLRGWLLPTALSSRRPEGNQLPKGIQVKGRVPFDNSRENVASQSLTETRLSDSDFFSTCASRP